MRASVILLVGCAIVSSVALYLVRAHLGVGPGGQWPAREQEEWILAIKSVVLASWLLIFLWGPVAFVKDPALDGISGRAWQNPATEPMSPVGEKVPVRTGTVLAEYRPRLAEYGAFARRAAGAFGWLTLIVLVYVAYSLLRSSAWREWTNVLLLAVVVPLAVGFGWIAAIFARSRVLIHPDGATIVGAFRKVVISNSPNCVIALDEARTSLTDLGSLYIDRATRRRCAVWTSVFDITDADLNEAVLRVAPRVELQDRPSRELARYVSLGERMPFLPLLVIVWGLVFFLSWSARASI